MTAHPSPLHERLSKALLEARKRRDTTATSVLRTALSAIANAEAVPMDTHAAAGAIEESAVGAGASEAPRRDLDDEEIRAILATEITERLDAADSLGDAQPDAAARLRHEAAVLTELSTN